MLLRRGSHERQTGNLPDDRGRCDRAFAMTRRVLFVAMQSSIHVARWIRLIARKPWDLHLFPVNDHDPNPDLRKVELGWPMAGSASLPAR